MFEKVKIKNIKNILLCLLREGSATKPQLVRATALSNSTVSDAVNAMLALGFLLTDGEEASIGGRRSRIYRLNAGFGCFLGLCLAPDAVQLCRTDARGALLAWSRVPWQAGEPADRQLYRLLEAACADRTWGNVLGVGIGVDGAVDYPAQTVVHSGIPAWDGFPLAAALHDRFGPCFLTDHLINGQIALHKVFGGARETDDFAVLCEDFGRKLALCLDGHTCRGAQNLCGQAADLAGLCAALRTAAPLLDLDRVLGGWRTPAGKRRLEALAVEPGMPAFQLYEAGEADLALGMALLGEIRWFETVYYLVH